MKTENLLFDEPHFTGGRHLIYKFDNGYGASIIPETKLDITKLSSKSSPFKIQTGLFELAVIKFTSSEEYALDYTTPITKDVLRYLPETEVDELLNKIASL